MEDKLYFYRARVVSIWDGDSLTASISLGFNFQFEKLKIRLYGIDTPELRGDTLEEARLARDFLKGLILEKDIYVETIKDKKGKYGRYLAKIWLEKDGEYININDLLVSEGYAIYREY
jgi:micrococcal nuclease